MTMPSEKVYTFRDSKMIDSLERNFDYSAIEKKRRDMINSIMRMEDDALRRAVSRKFGVDDPFSVVSRCTCITNTKGDRRYICLDDGFTIISISAVRTSSEDGKIYAHLDYRTFDGLE